MPITVNTKLLITTASNINAKDVLSPVTGAAASVPEPLT